MSKVFSAVKVIAAAGICGIGVGYAVLGYDSSGNGFVGDGATSLIQRLLLTVAAPLLSAVVAYKNGDTNITIKHVFTDERCQDIANTALGRESAHGSSAPMYAMDTLRPRGSGVERLRHVV
jgi:hypothetical protein